MRTKILGVGLLLVAMGLSGCFGEDSGGSEDGGETTSPTDDGNQTSEPAAWTVTITDYNETANVGEPFMVQWSVDPQDDPTVEVTSTAVHYGNQSVQDPQSPADYGNTSGESLATTPQTFSTNITSDEPDTIYLRAHAVIDGVDYWSEEVMVEVGGVAGEVVEVRISNGALPQLSAFQPADITIKVGDAVSWTNNDDATHTAEAADGSFDTGDIPAGNTTEPIVFETAGEYSYRCGYHPQTMTGTITVEDA